MVINSAPVRSANNCSSLRQAAAAEIALLRDLTLAWPMLAEYTTVSDPRLRWSVTLTFRNRGSDTLFAKVQLHVPLAANLIITGISKQPELACLDMDYAGRFRAGLSCPRRPKCPPVFGKVDTSSAGRLSLTRSQNVAYQTIPGPAARARACC